MIQPDNILDRQTLIEHIVKLQRISARKSEKLDFLEEHVKSLVAELQKKSQLLQTYILREQAGALSSNAMDKNKVKIELIVRKKEIYLSFFLVGIFTVFKVLVSKFRIVPLFCLSHFLVCCFYVLLILNLLFIL